MICTTTMLTLRNKEMSDTKFSKFIRTASEKDKEIVYAMVTSVVSDWQERILEEADEQDRAVPDNDTGEPAQ